jgi:hypothetical protein
MGLREFRLRNLLKQNLDFLAGIFEEVGFCMILLFLGLVICYFCMVI